MKTHKKSLGHLLWRLLLILSLVMPAALAVNIEPVQAGGGGPLPLVGLITSWVKRNKTYRTANSFIKEKEQYYDSLRDTAAQQLLDSQLMNTRWRRNRVAAYTKVVALIEQERGWMNDFAESEKKAARTEFIDAIQDEITNRMLASTPATELLGAMSKGINSSQGFLDSALDKLSGGGGGFLDEIAKVKRIADRMTIAGGMIGGNFGKAIQKAGSNISDFINKPTAEIEAGLVQVQEELGDLGDLVSGLQGQGFRPTASQTTREVVISLVTGEESDNPSINQIVDMVIAKHGGGGGFRDRAKDILMGNLSARCVARLEKMRRVVFKLQMEPEEYEQDDDSDIPTCAVIDLTALVEEADGAESAAEPAQSEAENPDAADPGQAADPADAQPSDPAADSAQPGTISSSSEVIWVLTKTVTNVNNDQTAFYGGGSDPYWFPEARFEGKSAVFNCSATSFTVTDINVDYGYEYHNVTMSVNFESPPAQLDPGQEVKLSASASGSGTVNEGGGNPGIALSYFYNNNRLEPALSYSPWAGNFEGKSTENWSFISPVSASEGSEFTVSAGLWNVPPCNVIWTYQAQLNQNRIESQEPAQEVTGSGPADSREEERCSDLRQQVASKVSIARGADTADLALGIIGHIQAITGDVNINYCEGGGAQVQKGIPIRVGDCIETGSNGRLRLVLNDRDNQYNADPTSFGMGSNSKLCFPSFAVHRDDGKPGLVDMIKGAIRVITRGWQPDSGLGVNVGVRAAVTVASDIVLEYDPDLDLLRTYVNQGSVVVANNFSGESQNLSDGELLITHQESIGSVEKMSNRIWKDLVAEQGLDLEDDSLSDDPPSSLLERLNLPIAGIGLILTGLCGGLLLVLGVVVVIIIKTRKKKAGENQSEDK